MLVPRKKIGSQERIGCWEGFTNVRGNISKIPLLAVLLGPEPVLGAQ